MADEQPNPIDAAHQVIVLAFNLADSEIPQLPNQIGLALQSPQVQAAIRKTLLDFANSKAGSGGAVPSAADGQKLLEAMGTGVLDAAWRQPPRPDQEDARIQKAGIQHRGVQKRGRVVVARHVGR